MPSTGKHPNWYSVAISDEINGEAEDEKNECVGNQFLGL
jgi:hypothetical protein